MESLAEAAMLDFQSCSFHICGSSKGCESGILRSLNNEIDKDINLILYT
jgi:hypothetical protein